MKRQTLISLVVILIVSALLIFMHFHNNKRAYMGRYFASADALLQVHDQYVNIGPESARELMELLILRNYHDHEELLSSPWGRPLIRSSYESVPLWKPRLSQKQQLAEVRERRIAFQQITGITDAQMEYELWSKLIITRRKEPTTASTPTNEPANGGSP